MMIIIIIIFHAQLTNNNLPSAESKAVIFSCFSLLGFPDWKKRHLSVIAGKQSPHSQTKEGKDCCACATNMYLCVYVLHLHRVLSADLSRP